MIDELLVMRHAKSDWGSPAGSDHDRPLNPRGETAARLMGRFLGLVDAAPQSILSSSAVRACATAELAAGGGEFRCAVEVVPALYGASPEGVLEMVQAVAEAVDGRLMVVGHEPTMSGLVQLLTGGLRLHFSTAAVACLRREGSAWTLTSGGCAELRWMVTPKLVAPLL